MEDLFGDAERLRARRERLEEDTYFYQQERKAREKQQRLASLELAAKALMDTLGMKDADTAAELSDAGFTPETVRLLFLVPAVQVAWSDREAGPKEKKALHEIANRLGAPDGSAARAKLDQWLQQPPTPAFFHLAIRALKALFDARPADALVLRGEILGYCSRVAEAAGGLLGLARVSDEEQTALQRLAAELQ